MARWMALMTLGLAGCGSSVAQVPLVGPVAIALGAAKIDYLPLSSTTRWTYRVADKLAGTDGDRVLTVKSLSAKDGQTAILVELQDGREISRQQVAKNGHTIRMDAYGLTLDMTKLQHPGLISQKADRTITLDAFEPVDTPAGRFDNCPVITVDVLSHMGHSGQEYHQVDHLWLASGVGPVKRVYEEGYTDPRAGGWSHDLIVSTLSKFQP